MMTMAMAPNSCNDWRQRYTPSDGEIQRGGAGMQSPLSVKVLDQKETAMPQRYPTGLEMDPGRTGTDIISTL